MEHVTNDPGEHGDGRHSLSVFRRTFMGMAGGVSLLPGLARRTRGSPTGGSPTTPGEIPLEEYLEDPQVIGENQEPAHVPTVPYASVRSALALERAHDSPRERWKRSPYFRSLDGEWDFVWSIDPDEAPDDLDAVEEWDTITVPRTWQAEGYGHSMYRNVTMDLWPYDPPSVPDEINPVGTYRRSFAVPDEWADRRTVLRFDGVKSAYFVWVNGEYVGYDEGSMTAAEFDVSDAVEPGRNTVSVRVFRWSSGSYLENQDMWHWAGIFRNVSIYSTPRTHLRDYVVRTDLDDDYADATLSVDAEVASVDDEGGSYAVRARLFDSDYREVATVEEPVTVAPGESARVTLERRIPDPAKWSAEHPTLYRLGLELLAVDGSSTEPIDAHLELVGFREFEIVDGQVRVNGRPVDFRGVNRHEHHPDFGRYVDDETLRADFERAKQFNVNAFRNSHYPRGPTFYEFADRFGIYVQDEVNAETHQNTALVDEYPEYETSFLDRFERMVQQYKNRASIVMWSTGNEAGLGPAHFEMADYATEVDPTRFLYHQANNGGVAPYAHIVGPRYVSPSGVEGILAGDERRPVVMGEYAHAMGNSLGLVERYWELVAEYPQFQGGFVWDWVNQGLNSALVSTPDASGTGNDGVVHGNPIVVTDDGGVRTQTLADGESVAGGGLALSGLDDWVELYRDPNLDVTEPGLTLEVEVRPREPWTGAEPFLAKGDYQYALKMADEETLQFFVYDPDDGWVVVEATVPDDWVGSWHHVAGVHTGSELQLYVDGEQVASTPHEGSIGHNPEPVTIGRNADLHGANTTTWLSNAVYRRAAIYDRALSASELVADRSDDADEAVLWLDFAEFARDGRFRTYGIDPFCCNGVVAADREPQPELWELKKAHQPVAVEAADLAAGVVAVTNRHHFTDLDALDATWELAADDEVVDSGALDLSVSPGERREVTIPFETPEPEAGRTYWLTVRFVTAEDRWWADAGHEVAFEQFEVPFDVPEPPLASPAEMPAVSVEGVTDR